MKLVIEDAFWPCCGAQYRDRKELIDHQLSDFGKHREVIIRMMRQHARMWAILKKQRRALQMRKELDEGASDWWE